MDNLQSLKNEISRMQRDISEIKNKIETHQHGSTGSSQIYNEPIKIKPGNTIEATFAFGKPTQTVIKGGVIRSVTGYHKLVSETGTVDSLDTIDVYGTTPGQLLILEADAGQDITVKDGTGNIRLKSDCLLESSFDKLLLVQNNKFWVEVSRSLNVSQNDFVVLGNENELIIASGSITPTSSYHQVDTEGNAATDDLDTIVATNVEDGTILVIRASSSTRTVVVKDNTGNIQLNGDCSLDNLQDTLTLIWIGTNWLELARSNNGT